MSIFTNSVTRATTCAGLSFLAAAAMGSTAFSQELRLLVPAGGTGDGLIELAEQYNDAQPDVRITAQRFPSGDPYSQAVVTQLQSGSGPDLIFTNGGWGALESILDLGSAGRLLDLSDTAIADVVPEAAQDTYWLDGELYGLPLSLLHVGMVYNANLLEEHDIELPADEAGFLEFCAETLDLGFSAASVSGPGPLYMIAAIANTRVYTDNPEWNAQREAGEVTFGESQGWRETFEYYQDMAEAGCFQPGFEAAGIPQLFAAMAGAQVLTGVGPATLMGAVMGMNPEIDLRMTTWVGGGENGRVAIADYNDSLSINAATEHEDAAVAFVEWVAEPAQQAVFAEVAGGTPLSVADTLEFGDRYADLVPYHEAGRVTGLPHTAWRNVEVRDAINAGANGLVTGQFTVDEVLAMLDEAWDD
ncbi:ABC transporter substrate-binding protein [Pelagibacterium halotolerans]|uniref:Sugar ABC transporter substrate-binding protein n=1 Tax=Pelagibacterium halotolerans (strain DSM 22347 / JCM 15775 / CGMCC 1.7692 / B2) TaxID=1082931 RepID=G4R7E9_PELHB|nr:ABC transporter substrate-binding protein [Pelagibacterium halotolerans]AEQ51287.1 sugar ABC transporter substrate-binding protein [Pelagibacterium halotolerans B2]QJR18856.1 carbohydrate ABC transporter substrate-binding protein [Pelagibacterium halotolerans]SEA66402.1 carbohydrate ABC transporter substrate-binding protein, CUT1 family [Pelagibacterium halotolerans]